MLDEGTHEVEQGGRELVALLEGKAATRPLGLSDPEGPDQSHLGRATRKALEETRVQEP